MDMFADRVPVLVPLPSSQAKHANFMELLTTSPGMELHRSTAVDVACTEPSEDAYSGDVRLRQSVELKFGDFVAYYQAKAAGTSHWLMETETDLQFYLAQCPLFSASDDVAAVLPHLLPTVASLRPPILDNVNLTQVNLWMTVAPSETSVHYDAYENILHVLDGTKHVRLYPPSATPAIQPHAIFSKSSNHTTLTLNETKALPPLVEFTVPANCTVACILPALKPVSFVAALYIPEGWWHQVRSDAHTVAINYWFDGLRPRLLAQPAMVPYYARVLVQDLVRSARLETIKMAIEQSRHRLHSNGVLSQLTTVDALVEFIANARDASEREDALLCAPSTLLYPAILSLSERQPSVWSMLLQGASVELVEFLTDAWDDHAALSQSTDNTSPNAYFSAIFSSCPFDVQDSLLTRKDTFGRQCAQRVLASTLGLQ